MIDHKYSNSGVMELIVQNYRNFDNLKIAVQNSKIIITGDNGTGKTNLLESISLLNPGRGLRNTKFEYICNNIKNSKDWCLSALLLNDTVSSKIDIQYTTDACKRDIFLNGSAIASKELLYLTKIIWLTPQMEGVFREGASDRRKLLDRMVYSFHNNYAFKIRQYEFYLKERMHLLQNSRFNTQWINTLEEQLTNLAIEITNYRIDTIKILQKTIFNLNSPFPKAKMTLEGSIESLVSLYSENQLEQQVQKSFYESRRLDAQSNRSNFGPQRSNFIVNHADKNTEAAFCSIGEQKALLISLMIAQFICVCNASKKFPILLLDEVFVHLDLIRRKYLADFLSMYPVQCWISTTETQDAELFPSCDVIKLPQ